MTNHQSTHAAVIGGSMAGLCAARVLADHFDQVTIIDRDRFPQGPEFRPGVPQSRHTHALLRRGLVVLNELFPGLEEDMVAKGAVPLTSIEFLTMNEFGWARRFDGPRLLSAGRELMESAVRDRVLALPNLSVLARQDAVGLEASADGAIRGVRLRERGETESPSQILEAALIVDASGRTSKAPQWLESLGYPPPRETTIDSFLGYATRYYAIPSHVEGDWKVLFVGAKPPAATRGAALLPIEGGRWMLTLFGYSRDYPPTEEGEFLEFARGLGSPIVYETIRAAEPLSPIRGYRATVNRRRHYESLSRFPEGLVVIGDAACAFNPVYGQGMSVAALNAQALARCLERQPRRHEGSIDLAGLSRAVQAEVAEASEAAWLVATGADVRWPATVGARPGALTRVMQRYFDRVVAHSNCDAAVSAAFQRVVHLIDAPSTLLHPKVAVRVLTRSATPLSAPPISVGANFTKSANSEDAEIRSRR